MAEIEASVNGSVIKRTGIVNRSSLIAAAICVLFSIIAALPFFFISKPVPGNSPWSLRMPATHDMRLHYDQMRSFYEGLKAGSIYPRWEEETNRGFGAPTTSYYPPGIYYVTSAFYLVTRDWIEALLGSHLLLMMMSAAAIYLYARQVMSRVGAVAAMGAYVIGPYHLIDQYQRGAIAELMGFVIMPWMLMCAEELMEKRRVVGEEVEDRSRRMRREVRAVAMLGVSYGVFVWTHPPTAYQFSLGFGVYVMMMGVMRREWKGLMKVMAGVMIGVGLSAAYILPAALEQSLINSDNIAQTYPYHDSYTLVRWGVYNTGHPDYFLSLLDKTWILTVLFIVIAAVALLGFKTQALRRAPRLKRRIILWLILGCFMCFMMTSLSYPLGRFIPKIEIGVFTWRMLSVTTLVVALLAGACAQVAFQTRKRLRHEAVLAASVAIWIVVGSAWFSLEEVVKPYSNGDAFMPEPEHMNYALMPRAAYGDIFHLPKVDPVALAQGRGSVVVERWLPEHRLARVVLSGPDRLLFRTFDFPGWTVTVDGRTVNKITGRGLRIRGEGDEESIIRKLDYAGWTPSVDGKPVNVLGEIELGDIAIELERGVHEVRLDYLPTPVRRWSGIITMVSFGLLFVLLLMPMVLQRRRRRDIENVSV